MKPLKDKISITIDSDLLEILRKEAERDDRSLSQYINLVLRSHVDRSSANEGAKYDFFSDVSTGR